MRNNDFENLYFDYFTNSPSYVKMVLDLLPEGTVSIEERSMHKAIYNFIMNNLSDNKKMEIAYVTSMFRDKVEYSSKEEINEQVNVIYKNFLKKMIGDSINRETFFNIMNEHVKVYVDFYSEYQVININSVDGVKIEKGSYR